MPELPRQPGDAERALRSVTAVREVVQAVWALARAQVPLAEAAAGDAGAYLDWIEQLMERLAGPFSRARSAQTLWVVLGPERTFCGPLSQRVLNQLPGRGALALVGRQLAEQARGLAPVRERVVLELAGISSTSEIEEAARRIAAALLAIGHGGRVALLHPSGSGDALRRRTLLAGPRDRTSQPPDTWSPLERVLQAATEELVSGCLVVGLAETLRAEVNARLMAADAARRACDRRLALLEQTWRMLRQEQITAELIELVSGHLGSGRGGGPGTRTDPR